MNWFFKNPLYFKILCLFEIKESKQNFCAIRCGKQIIEYNPDILETMTVAEIRNLLIAQQNLSSHHTSFITQLVVVNRQACIANRLAFSLDYTTLRKDAIRDLIWGVSSPLLKKLGDRIV